MKSLPSDMLRSEKILKGITLIWRTQVTCLPELQLWLQLIFRFPSLNSLNLSLSERVVAVEMVTSESALGRCHMSKVVLRLR